MRKVYLDNAATTKMHEEVFEAMKPYFTEIYGNPSSIHSFGREARKAVEMTREVVAEVLGAESKEIIFTSGATEANNLAIRGVARARQKQGNHIITSAVEHHAVLDTCKALQKEGFELTIIPVDEYGMVSVKDVEDAITEKTILITIMLANNEVGTINPIPAIGELCRKHSITFHTDAVQGIGNSVVNVRDLQVDLLSLSAHKFHGPKGTGVLYIRKGTKINVFSFGGAQERKLRPGTENVAGIVGLGKAIMLATTDMEKKIFRVTALREKLTNGLLAIDDTKLNGHPEARLPGNVNISVQYVEGESLILSLDLKGIAVSSGSACTSGSLDPSHVLMAMGLDHQTAHGSLRLTLSADNNEEDVDYVLEVLPDIVKRLRSMSPIYACKE